ncbi:MAG: ROK family protein [Pseudomonadota bacterium]
MKRLNLELAPSQQAMLHHIRKHRSLSRSQLGKLASLSSGAVTRFGRGLIDVGLLSETPLDRAGSSSGRPAQALSLRAEGGVAYGFALHPGWLECALLDFEGTVLQSSRKVLADATLDSAAELAALFVRDTRVDGPSIVFGAGVAVPGYTTTDPQRRRTVDALRSWREVDLPAFFTRALGMPVYVENDASAAVVAENYATDARDASVVMAITLDAGVGGGVMVEGRLLRGAHGNAGEIGWLYPYGKPRPSALDYLAMAAAADKQTTLEALVSGDADVDAAARRWCRRAGKQLVAAVNAGAGWLDPDRIVITGALPLPVLAETTRALAAEPLFEAQSDIPRPKPLASAYGAKAAAIGAGHLPFYALSFPLSASNAI